MKINEYHQDLEGSAVWWQGLLCRETMLNLLLLTIHSSPPTTWYYYRSLFSTWLFFFVVVVRSLCGAFESVL